VLLLWLCLELRKTMVHFENIKTSVIYLLENELPDNLFYHNVSHTLRVLEQAIIIANYEKVTEQELFLIKVAALFHDTGFTKAYANHEEESCKIAEKELTNYNFSEIDISTIKGLIMATKLPQTPYTKLEMILADADVEYLGTDLFLEIGNRLYKELQSKNKELTISDWNQLQIKFLTNHSYFTSYCKQFRDVVKTKHLQALKDNL
jgi:HD superfamily phosphodiesterase